jgi:hypothetical protein
MLGGELHAYYRPTARRLVGSVLPTPGQLQQEDAPTSSAGRVSGFVQSDEDLKRARQDAASVPGVVNVKDELELKREGSRGG